ncbi:MAG: hypothetical protein KA717_06770 [Woronichinia naegeliana WA131]|jgi:hypothetical protein|uniref:Uncharacterized protein n=1 Tax=Woronichinia naegeliana WA131 TaxID=2824559 RepID=A0A977KYX2_9CYAN|nr:MAG: hypothetical protein KA717_06770 [Woronichinia naegeliana WA131]
MNSFNEILNEIYDKVQEKHLYTKDFNLLLEYAIILWTKKIDFQKNINPEIFNDIKIFDFGYELYKEWNAKTTKVLEKYTKGFSVDAPFPDDKSPLYHIIQKLINKLPLRSQEMKSIKFIVFLGLVITAVGYVVFQLNQQKTATSNQGSLSDDDNPSYFLPEPKTLILVVNALKKDCLDKLESQGNQIQSEDCEKLYRATSFLWMGDELHPKLNRNLNNSGAFVVQEGAESEYDVYLLKIELSKANEGFEQNADQVSRIDAFRELEGLSVQISRRLKVSVYENTNIYTR